METTTIIISLTFLTCIVLYFVFVLVFTNSYGNNRPKISNIDSTKSMYVQTNITKCLGKFYPYKKIDVLDTYLDEPIKECEYLSYGDNGKFYFQSNGVYGRDDNLFGKFISNEDYPAKFTKSEDYFVLLDNKGKFLADTGLPTNDGKYTVDKDGKFQRIPKKIINLLSTTKEPMMNDDEILINENSFMEITKGNIVVGNSTGKIEIGKIKDGKGPYKLVLVGKTLTIQDSAGKSASSGIDYLVRGSMYKVNLNNTGLVQFIPV